MRHCRTVNQGRRFNVSPKPRSRKESRLTTIRHGGPSALRIEIRSAERGKSRGFSCRSGPHGFCRTLRGGGYGMIRTRNAAKPLSFISLIPLWLSTLNRPPRFRRGRKAGTRATPPKTGGSCDPDSGTERRTSIRSHAGSLSSSFIPAGRLGSEALTRRRPALPLSLVYSRVRRSE